MNNIIRGIIEYLKYKWNKETTLEETLKHVNSMCGVKNKRTL